jgi:hypothetical protein
MLKNLTYAEMEDWCEHIGERRQRARQLWRWLYADGGLIRAIDEAAPGVANGFSSAFLCACSPGSIRACLFERSECSLYSPGRPLAALQSLEACPKLWRRFCLCWSRAGRQALLS